MNLRQVAWQATAGYRKKRCQKVPTSSVCKVIEIYHLCSKARGKGLRPNWQKDLHRVLQRIQTFNQNG